MQAARTQVLLIEQESDLRQLNQLILREFGYSVETISPSEDPVSAAVRTRPDVIVLRIRSNEPHDWDILDRLQADPRTEAIPVVVISATERALVEAQAAPIVRQTIVMPYDIDALRRAVENALGHPPPAAVLPPSHHPTPGALAFAAKILRQHTRQLVLRTIRGLQQIEPFASRFAELSPGLVDDLSVAVGAIIAGIERDLSPDEVVAPAAIRDSIRQHADLWVKQGLGPGAIVREYQVLDDQILAFLREHVSATQFSAMDAFDVARTVDDYAAEMIRIAVEDVVRDLRQQQTTRA